MTPDVADARYVRLNRALHDLAAAIDTTEHAGQLIDDGKLFDVLEDFVAFSRSAVTDIQRMLERQVART